jgi:hypothetical protein
LTSAGGDTTIQPNRLALIRGATGGRLQENFPVLTSIENQCAPSRGASIKALLTHRRLLMLGCLALTTFGFSQYRNVILIVGM